MPPSLPEARRRWAELLRSNLASRLVRVDCDKKIELVRGERRVPIYGVSCFAMYVVTTPSKIVPKSQYRRLATLMKSPNVRQDLT